MFKRGIVNKDILNEAKAKKERIQQECQQKITDVDAEIRDANAKWAAERNKMLNKLKGATDTNVQSRPELDRQAETKHPLSETKSDGKGGRKSRRRRRRRKSAKKTKKRRRRRRTKRRKTAKKSRRRRRRRRK